MRKRPDYYDIGELRLFSVENRIEIPATGDEIAPSPMHRGFLLALIRKHPGLVSYEELWKEVWRSRHKMTEDDRAKIQTTKGQLAAWLKNKNIESLVIEAVPGKGYLIKNDIVKGWFDEEETEPEEIGKAGWKDLLFSNAIYIIVMALGYGILFQITEIMEIAFQLNIYGGQVIFGGLISMLINFVAILIAIGLISYRLHSGKSGLLSAVGVIFGAILLSIIISGQFLPAHSVTEANVQTQPALIAFWKNALIYFFPLGAIFILLPFYIISVRQLVSSKALKTVPADFIFIQPKWLLIICLCILLVSFLSTNYLLDRLNTESIYHNLFVGLILLRMFIYFGLAIGSLAWYQAKTLKLSRTIQE